MKKLSIPCSYLYQAVACACLLAVFGCSPAALSNGSPFSLNGKAIRLPGPVDQIIDALGKATRITDLENGRTRYVWDRDGVSAVASEKKGEITFVTIHYQTDSEWEPTSVFQKALVVGNTTIIAGASREDLLATGFTDPYAGEKLANNIFVKEIGDFGVSVSFPVLPGIATTMRDAISIVQVKPGDM